MADANVTSLPLEPEPLAERPLDIGKLTSATLPPSDVLHLSGITRKKSHVGRNSKGSLERRPRVGLDAHIEHLEYLEKHWIDLLACASSLLRAHRRACTP
ncbi:hypothetical protein T492DRAFT_855013 [Pavlovales sp. CCMP2436]|nr:hypothetical protein T492DRAFT_855013 [Pavlovales sp. CCMP2436]